MKGNWKSAGEVLEAVLDRAGVTERFRRESALLCWKEVVGDKIAQRARPKELRGKTLVVDVDTSPWMYELSFMKRDILRELNSRVGGNAIERIVFVASGGGECA